MMNNRLIIAAAGSGKTTYLVKQALAVKGAMVLITTFTEANGKEINKKFIELNGVVPSNVNVQTWFSFLLQHGVKPYQSVITDRKINGILLVNQRSGLKYMNKKFPVYYSERETDRYYFDKGYRIYTDKISKFSFRCNEQTNGDVIKRICKIYQYIFIDEIQDLAGYDLELINLLMQFAENVLMVGDPRQVTYHTHDEQMNSAYKWCAIEKYIKDKCKKIPYTIDKTTLNCTFRNNKMICDFANSIYPEFETCESKQEKTSEHDGVFLIKPSDVDTYLKRYSPVQLRDKITVNVNNNYKVKNFGDSKGLTLKRVLIYPTSPMTKWLENHSKELKDQSKSKFYVAVTRAVYSTAIVYNYTDNTNIDGVIKFSF